MPLKKCSSIREYLRRSGLSQTEFARRIGVSKPTANLYVHGKRRPSPEIALRIERLTGIPFKRLVLGAAAKQKR